MSLRFINMGTCVRIFFLFQAELYFTVCMHIYHISVIHSFIDAHWIASTFKLVWIMLLSGKAYTNTSMRSHFQLFGGIYPKVELLDQMVKRDLTYLPIPCESFKSKILHLIRLCDSHSTCHNLCPWYVTSSQEISFCWLNGRGTRKVSGWGRWMEILAAHR